MVNRHLVELQQAPFQPCLLPRVFIFKLKKFLIQLSVLKHQLRAMRLVWHRVSRLILAQLPKSIQPLVFPSWFRCLLGVKPVAGRLPMEARHLHARLRLWLDLLERTQAGDVAKVYVLLLVGKQEVDVAVLRRWTRKL